jgi:hypothetical protein
LSTACEPSREDLERGLSRADSEAQEQRGKVYHIVRHAHLIGRRTVRPEWDAPRMEQLALLDEMVVLSTLRRSVLTARAAQDEEAAAVALARRAGWSWDRIGRELSVNGETLRRHYSERRRA